MSSRKVQTPGAPDPQQQPDLAAQDQQPQDTPEQPSELEQLRAEIAEKNRLIDELKKSTQESQSAPQAVAATSNSPKWVLTKQGWTQE